MYVVSPSVAKSISLSVIMILSVVVVLFVLYAFYECYWKTRSYPPGPIPLPILGNVLSLIYYGVPETLDSYYKTYGTLVTIWFGGQPFVLFNDLDLMNETFVKDGDTYAGRTVDSELAMKFVGGKYGIVMTDGPLWREQRRFVLKVFRDFGLGRNEMQERVLDEVVAFIETVEKAVDAGDDAIPLQDVIDVCIGSIINNLTLGSRLTDKAKFDNIKGIVSKVMEIAGNPALKFAENNLWLAERLPYFRDVVNSQVELFTEVVRYFEKEIEEHRAIIDLDDDQEPRDYADAFLRQQHKLQTTGKGLEHYFSDKQLALSLLDLWIAGQETTTNTLAWLVLYLITNPDVQQKLHDELDREIGSERIITVADRPNLHYLQAVINESQRVCNLLPINIPHRLTKEVQVRGYRLAADTVVVPQISQVMSDDAHFPDSTVFDPERFLDAHGKFVASPFNVPFGLGKRSCAGEPLARLELFLFTANIFNRLKLEQNPKKPVDMTRVAGITICPRPFVCTATMRY